MVIMSIDYGDVRTGVAVCDELEMLAHPVCVIKEAYQPRLVEKIAQMAREENARLLVVGYPKNMDGSPGERAEKCGEFAKLLCEETGLPVKLWDERLTTVSAHNLLNAADVRGKKRKQTVDAVAAVIILEDYLRFRKTDLSL